MSAKPLFCAFALTIALGGIAPAQDGVVRWRCAGWGRIGSPRPEVGWCRSARFRESLAGVSSKVRMG